MLPLTTFDAQISCCLINARSVCNKNDIFLDYIISNDIDLAVITGTWLDEGANFDIIWAVSLHQDTP